MESDGNDELYTEALSFDSTLDSLVDADFMYGESSLPFTPPSGAQMSADINEGADIVSDEGGSVTKSAAHEKEMQEKNGNGNHGMDFKPLHHNGTKMEQNDDRNVETDNDSCKELENNISEKLDKDESNVDIGDTKCIKEKKDKILTASIKNLNVQKLKEMRKRNLAVKIHKKGNEKVKSDKTKSKVELTKTESKSVESKKNKSCVVKQVEKRKHKETKDSKTSNEPISKLRKVDQVSSETLQSNDIPNNQTKDNVGNKLVKIYDTQEDGENVNEVYKEDKAGSNISEDKNLGIEEIQANIVDSASDVPNSSEQSENEISTIDASSSQVDENQSTLEESAETITEESVNVKEIKMEIPDVVNTNVNIGETSNNEVEMETDKESDKIEINRTSTDINMKYNGDDDNDDDDDDNSDNVDELDDEIYGWLEEGVQKQRKDKDSVSSLKEGEYIAREKMVLEEKGVNPFEVLPEGWVSVTHNSGMHVYLHRQTRVCTMAKPYFIGPGSVRKHNIPLSAIPCLQYRREKQNEVEEQQKDPEAETTDSAIPTATLKSADALQVDSIGSEELHGYCKSLFNFKVVTVKEFRTWKEKRTHLLDEKKKIKEKEKQLPGLPSDTMLITCKLPNDDAAAKKSTVKKKEFVLNPLGKTPVCILHEYTQHCLKVQPTYEFKEIENAETPYKASVYIGGIMYGSGVASGKRMAKSEAAKATLEVFMPSLIETWKDGSVAKMRHKGEQMSDLSFFDEVSIEDPRVADLCDKAALSKPFEVLHECLRRNFGMGDTNINIDKKMISNQKTEFSLTVGKHTTTVTSKNKREGKQRAAQAMLQVLHPNLKSWGAIIRLYSKSTVIGFKEKKDEEESLRQNDMDSKKNFEILEKLKIAMRKVKTQREEVDKTTVGNVQSTTQTLDL